MFKRKRRTEGRPYDLGQSRQSIQSEMDEEGLHGKGCRCELIGHDNGSLSLDVDSDCPRIKEQIKKILKFKI